MIKLEQTGETRGDCCAPYAVSNYEARTVGDFVDEVVNTFVDEWGEILVLLPGKEWWNCAQYEYKHGVITSESTEDFANLKIKKITAYGGWSYMLYTIEVEEEKEC